MIINEKVGRTAKTLPGPVSINQNLCRTPLETVFLNENSNWQHSDRQSIFLIKKVITNHFMLYLVQS